MGLRVDLHKLLTQILGSKNVYYQPPANIQMVYPCIIYAIDDVDIFYADNESYSVNKRYSVTVIDRAPENAFVDALLRLPMASYSRRYTTDNLNHDSLTIYY